MMGGSELETPIARAETAPASHALPRAPWSRRWGWLALFTAAGLALFAAYLRQAQTAPVMSDGASNALQAWDLLHGNVLLRGWTMSDVSFYTTEIPQYMLVVLAHGLDANVIHIAAAMSYALLVLGAALLARGHVSGREGAVRMLIAAGIMLAPSLGHGTVTLLSHRDPGPHAGDLAAPGPRARALVGAGHGRGPAGLGAGRRPDRPVPGGSAAGAGLRVQAGPAARLAAGQLV
jgi:hypothetical protein